MQETNEDIIIRKLIENSKAAIMGAVELHNKPIFPYRYEISVLLTINAWELAMKAYILTYHKEVKVFEGDWSKEFPSCLGFISSTLGKDFLPQKENIELIYKYRCEITHFYSEGIELILYSLLRPNILYFSDFLLKYFHIDLGKEANLIILPIGFKRIVSPVDFLSENLVDGNEPTKEFIKSIMKSAKALEDNGIEDGLICNYNLVLENVSRIKNADIVVGITNDKNAASLVVNKIVKVGSFTHDANAPSYRIDEQSLFVETFVFTNKDFITKLKEAVPSFKESNPNKTIIRKEIREDANCFKIRYLDVIPHAKSIGKGFFSQAGIDKAIKIFKTD